MNRNENTRICSCRRIDDVVFVLFYEWIEKRRKKRNI